MTRYILGKLKKNISFVKMIDLVTQKLHISAKKSHAFLFSCHLRYGKFIQLDPRSAPFTNMTSIFA